MSLVGVKYTTARAVAAAAVDVVTRKLGVKTASRTSDVPLPGGEVRELDALLSDARRDAAGLVEPAVADQLALTYGTLFAPVLSLARSAPWAAARLAADPPVIAAQVAHGVRDEMALTLVDVVARRVPLGAAGHPGRAAAEACARVMAAELGWGPDRITRELKDLDRFYAPVPPPD